MMPNHQDRSGGRNQVGVEADVVHAGRCKGHVRFQGGDDGLVGVGSDEAVHMQRSAWPGTEDVQDRGVFVLAIDVEFVGGGLL